MIVKSKKFLIKICVKKEVQVYTGLANALPQVTGRSSPSQVTSPQDSLEKLRRTRKRSSCHITLRWFLADNKFKHPTKIMNKIFPKSHTHTWFLRHTGHTFTVFSIIKNTAYGTLPRSHGPFKLICKP